MGAAVPQVVTESSASGAQVIDGSLKFDNDSSQYLSKTFSSAGNRDVWTWSSWVRRSNSTEQCAIFSAYNASNNANYGMIWLNNDGTFNFQNWDGGSNSAETSALLRDTGWYHLVVLHDESASPKAKLYVNGTLQTLASNLSTSQGISGNWEHRIGMEVYNSRKPYDGSMSQCYFIDGQALGPESFGYTDGLTGTWRPKKFKPQATPNDGTTWSNYLTRNDSGQSWTRQTEMFSGSLSDNSTVAGGFYFEPPSDFTGITSLRVYMEIPSDGYTITLNDNTTKTGTGAFSAGWNDLSSEISTEGGTLSKIKFVRNGSGGNVYPYIYALEIDGVTLLDNDTSNMGVNAFHLPMDGNSPIGQDQSGRGNNWTPVNFGGSVALDNPIVSGARPILNTTQGGTQAGVGVFGSKQNVGYAVTVYNDGGGNKYYIDGVKQATLTGLIRGATYTFDTSDSTVSSHPFRFSATSNGSHGGGSEYVDGVAAITGTATTITIPHNAPNQLYYYCTSHSGMGSSITGITTNASLADPFAWKNNLALPYVGGGGDVTASIGATNTSLMTSWSQNSSSFQDGGGFYNSALFMNSASDYPRINFSAGAMNFMHNSTGTGTIEFWANSSTVSTGAIWASTSGGSDEVGFGIYSFTSGTEIGFFISKGVLGQSSSAATGKTPNGKWVHIAAVKTPTELRLYTDGVLRSKVDISSYSFSSSNSTRNYIQHGSPPQQSGTRGWTGAYMQDFRVYEGLEKYTGTTVGTQYFVPASTSADILPDTPSGVSGSSKLVKVTDGAVSFDGSGDYLSLASSSDFAFGTGDFTVECLVYNEGHSATGNVIDCRTDTKGWGFQISSSTEYFTFYSKVSASSVLGNMGPISKNKWTHLAVTRSSGTVYGFIDGVLQNSASHTSDYSDNTPCIIGARYSEDQQYFNGFISNTRIVKGTALYTANFTPSSAPLTNVTNTKLLCCQSNLTSGAAAVSPSISGINDGTVWSSTVTGPTRKEDRVANAFNGSTSGPGAIPAYPGTLTFAPGLTSISSVKIYGYYAGSGVTLHVNGSAQSPSSGAFTLTISTSTLDSVVWTATDGFNYMRIDAIEIDSTVLIDPVVGPDDSNETATNFNPFNTDINTVRGQESGYATLNPLDNLQTLSNGNLSVTGISANWEGTRGTIGMSSGKFYWEWSIGFTNSTDNQSLLGIAQASAILSNYASAGAYGWEIYSNSGQKFNNGSPASYGDAYTIGDVIGVAFDADNGTLTFYKNGVSQGEAYNSLTSGPYYPSSSLYGTSLVELNFGQKPFKFPPPEGFQPLNAANVRPETVITRPDQYVGVVAYTGDGNSPREIGGFGFQPDLVVYKERSEARDWQWYDSVRGVGPAKNLVSNTNYAETANDDTQYGYTSSFNKDGFTVTNGTGGGNANIYTNKNGQTYASWTWRAGGNKNTFNVDDVGYASASDVNMNVGGLNSSTINQGQLWSGLITPASGSFDQAATLAFNGLLQGDPNRLRTSGNAILVTMTFSTPVTVSSQVKVIAEPGYDSTCTVTVGGTKFTSSSGSTHTFNVSGSLTQMTLVANGGSGRTYMEGMEIDGKLLVDSNVTINVPSIAATGCSVGTKQGFSIIGWTGNETAGATIPHGLGKTPGFAIFKSRETALAWGTYHQSLGATERVLLNSDAAASADPNAFNNIEPTSSIITLGASDAYNDDKKMIAYIWHDVPGLQKFGQYTGNGNTNGPFIELGFRPAVIFLKRTDSASSWQIRDTTRSPHNVVTENLYPNLSNAESTDSSLNLDILSNGFKPRTSTDGGSNANNGTYIYCAWAEAPTVNLFGAQSNAR